MVPLSKSGVVMSHRGFESRPLRHFRIHLCGVETKAGTGLTCERRGRELNGTPGSKADAEWKTQNFQSSGPMRYDLRLTRGTVAR
jgi:hypothetical protein